MSNARLRVQSGAPKWGWGILIALSAFLTLNGVGLYFMSSSPAIFEQDTGVPMAEARQAYPTLVDQVVREGQNISILMAGLGLLTLVVVLEGFRHGSHWAWNANWVLVAVMVAIGVQMLVVTGRLGFGISSLALAAVALVGQLLARRGLAP